MRRPGRTDTAALALLALLTAAAAAAEVATEEVATEEVATEAALREEPLLVTGVAFEESAGDGGAALGELLASAMRARGVAARAVPPPAGCSPPHAPDAAACLHGVLAALARGALAAAALPAPCGALPAPPRLREAGLAAWGALEAGGGARRACWARGALLSLAELAGAERARAYAAPPGALDELAPPRYFCGAGDSPPRSSECGPELATALVGPDEEARVLLRAAAPLALRLQVRALGAAWRPARALELLEARGAAAVLCGRGLRVAGARALGPPPCSGAAADCAFDARPLLKLADARALARRPAAARALDRLSLPAGGARALAERAATAGAPAAARAALAAGSAAGGAREARVAALVPLSTRREVEPAAALRAAAELAEEDEAASGAWGAVRLKVQVADAACGATGAAAWLTSALGSEFGSLAGAAGPACASAFPGAARHASALGLPLLAYTAQAPAPGALLAAGSLGERVAALRALLAALGWRRAAVLSEAGSRGALPAARLDVQLAVHVELPEGEELAEDLVDEWAQRAADATARVLVLLVEDARAARAALCAAARRGLTPAHGAVLVLAQAHGAGWLRAPAPCDLAAQAEGHLRLQPAWAARWERGPPPAWTRRWRARLAAPAPPAPPPAPPASAAMLYDTLRLWARALARLLAERPEALDDLHREDRVRWLVAEATRAPYVGLTGALQWTAGALLVQQWRDGAPHDVGRWEGGALALDGEALRWGTADGRAPDDGAEGCARRPLARECRAAALGGLALALTALLALLAGGAWHCRRRAAREHRARLAAFGMRALGPRGPDRWELPRERVVINRRLGAGAFGAVYGGHALLGGGRGWAAVAVKTLRAGAGTEEKLDFLSEAEAMKRLSHACVVRLLGVVTRTEPVCTVMEMMLHGDLKGFLVARRHLAGAGEVAPARLTGMAGDAARGLAYLARLRFVHRDVAARNCLVGATLRVKLADFGMTRVVFDNDYYRFERKGMLPVRWMAPESLALGVFSPASDVWSFGVLLYEIVTFGALPYRGLPNHEALRRAKAGRPPPLPPALAPQLEALIRSCWRRSARSRPPATALADSLARWPRLLTPSLAPPDALDAPLPASGPDAALDTDPFLPPPR